MIDKVIEVNEKKYRTLAFWSWDGKLEKNRLAFQIADMAKNLFGGFIIHARSGLKTEYLSEEWMDAVAFCIEEGKKYDMRVFIYDEFGWPSGFVGGKLLEREDYRAKYFDWSVSKEYKNADYVYALLKDGNYLRCDGKTDAADEYLIVNVVTDISNTDILKDEVTDAFIRETHEKYYSRFADEFGKGIEGFFTDEPQYYRYATPYSECLSEKLLDNYGLNLFDKLPELFLERGTYRRTRYLFYKTLHERYIENYAKKLHEWGKKHGVIMTGHTIEESRIFTQMWCCGSAMPFYLHEDIPCVDSLCRAVDAEFTAKAVGSVAFQTGKNQVLTESFACTGWDVTLDELRAIADNQYVCGVNMLTEHLYHYSFSGDRKKDHPVCFSAETPWHDRMKTFNTYYGRLGALLANSDEICETVVLNPVRSAWLTYERKKDAESVRDIDDGFLSAVRTLQRSGIAHHFADEGVLREIGKVGNGRLIIGEKSYAYLVIPYVLSLDENTEKIITDYIKSGGKVLMLGDKPSYTEGRECTPFGIKSNVTLNDIIRSQKIRFTEKNCGDVRFTLRKLPDGEYFAFFTNAPSEDDVKIRFECDLGAPAVKNLLSNGVYPLERTENGSFLLTLKKGESAFLTFVKDGKLPASIAGEKRSAVFRETSRTANYLTIDEAEISFDGKEFEKKQPVPGIAEKLLRSGYKGKLFVKYAFNCIAKPENLWIIFENGAKYCEFNGERMQPEKGSPISDEFCRVFVSAKTKTGYNEFVLYYDYAQPENAAHVLYGEGVTESLRNCFTPETEIESVYLCGDFSVEAKSVKRAENGVTEAFGDFSINTRKAGGEGELFFAGKVRYETDVSDFKDGKWLITPHGRFAALVYYLNGKALLPSSFDGQAEVELKKGDRLQVEITSGNRNLLGPHHCIELEPFAVAPVNFTMSGTWKDGKSPDYRESYSFVPFGLERIDFVPITQKKPG